LSPASASPDRHRERSGSGAGERKRAQAGWPASADDRVSGMNGVDGQPGMAKARSDAGLAVLQQLSVPVHAGPRIIPTRTSMGNAISYRSMCYHGGKDQMP